MNKMTYGSATASIPALDSIIMVSTVENSLVIPRKQQIADYLLPENLSTPITYILYMLSEP